MVNCILHSTLVNRNFLSCYWLQISQLAKYATRSDVFPNNFSSLEVETENTVGIQSKVCFCKIFIENTMQSNTYATGDYDSALIQSYSYPGKIWLQNCSWAQFSAPSITPHCDLSFLNVCWIIRKQIWSCKSKKLSV